MAPMALPPRRTAMLVSLALVAGAALAQRPTRDGPAAGKDAELIAAAERGDADAVNLLIASGADVKARDIKGRTALLAATQANRADIARVLIVVGSDVNAKDSLGDSPFLLAAASGHVEILALTLMGGADLRSVNRYGGTALIPAAHYGHVDVVRVLLATPIDVDHVNHLGWTALLEAVILGDGGPAHTEIVRLLLARGANPAIADRDGVLPLLHARRRGYKAIAELIRNARPR